MTPGCDICDRPSLHLLLVPDKDGETRWIPLCDACADVAESMGVRSIDQSELN